MVRDCAQGPPSPIHNTAPTQHPFAHLERAVLRLQLGRLLLQLLLLLGELCTLPRCVFTCVVQLVLKQSGGVG